MARKGGNPDFGSKIKAVLPEGVAKPRNELFAIRVSEELKRSLKEIDAEEIRSALQRLVDSREAVAKPARKKSRLSL